MYPRLILLLILLGWVPTQVRADIVSLNQFDLDYGKYLLPAYQVYPQPLISQPSAYLDLHMNLTILGTLYFNNMMHTTSDSNQFRSVGWNYQLGVHLTDSIDLYYNHYSQHVLDLPSTNHFPLENTVGVVWKIYSKDTHPESLF